MFVVFVVSSSSQFRLVCVFSICNYLLRSILISLLVTHGSGLCYIFSCSDSVDPDKDWCYWHYLGRGTQYQLLAGPMYTVLFAISGIPLGKCLSTCFFLILLLESYKHAFTINLFIVSTG